MNEEYPVEDTGKDAGKYTSKNSFDQVHWSEWIFKKNLYVKEDDFEEIKKHIEKKIEEKKINENKNKENKEMGENDIRTIEKEKAEQNEYKKKKDEEEEKKRKDAEANYNALNINRIMKKHIKAEETRQKAEAEAEAKTNKSWFSRGFTSKNNKVAPSSGGRKKTRKSKKQRKNKSKRVKR